MPVPATAVDPMWRHPDRQLWSQFWSSATGLSPGPDATDTILQTASDLIAAAPSALRQISHRDHKPDSCLLSQRNELVVLDWDEAGPTSLRAELVEAASRWSWTTDRPDPDAAAEFLYACDTAPGAITAIRDTIAPTDWANAISAAASWAEVLTTRSLTKPGDTNVRRDTINAINGCATHLASIDVWSLAINTAYPRATKFGPPS